MRTDMTRTLETLDRWEPGTPPSLRYNRVIRVGMAQVLEMRDPNEGQGGGPEDKCRHQYVSAGGSLWRRRLPPESVGDEWVDKPGPVSWERVAHLYPMPHLLRDFFEEAEPVGLLVVRRERFQSSDGSEQFFVRGEYVDAEEVDQVEVVAGPITGAWWEVPLDGLCPDCGGDLVWWEAGFVPGTRKCLGRRICDYDDDPPYYDQEGGCGGLYTVLTRGRDGDV